MLLGASISFQAVLEAGFGLILGIAVVVALAIGASYALGRWLGLPKRMAVLVACGNAICGNSAIAAVAPVIGAKPQDVASSIAFTAILGVVVVLALPLLVPLLDLSLTQYGVLAGLTVYAVPQVLAATVPVSLVSTQLGTLVKLVRVLMLGPVVIGLSLVAGRGATEATMRLSWSRLVPWFILGFLSLAAAALPRRHSRRAPTHRDARSRRFSRSSPWRRSASGSICKVLGRVGGRVTLAVTLSLLVLIAISLGLIRLLGLP